MFLAFIKIHNFEATFQRDTSQYHLIDLPTMAKLRIIWTLFSGKLTTLCFSLTFLHLCSAVQNKLRSNRNNLRRDKERITRIGHPW